MEWLVDNLSVICAVLVTILNVIALIVSKLSNKKNGTIITGISEVIAKLPEIINTAEKVADNGEERKAYAMAQAELLCKSIGFEPTPEQLENFSAVIDSLVALSKSINLYSNTKQPTVKTIGVDYGN